MTWPKGKKHSAETIETIRAGNLGKTRTEEQRQHVSEGLTGRPHPHKGGEVQRQLLIARNVSSRKYPVTSLGQRLIRQGWKRIQQALWPKRRRKWREDIPTSIERRTTAELQRVGVRFEVHRKFGPYTADVYLPDHEAIIECDGDYWHSLKGRREHDDRRDRWFTKRGIRVFRLPEHQINRDIVGCVRRVRAALEAR